MTNATFRAGLAAIAVLAFARVAAGDVAEMAEDCDGCHGKNGVSEHTDMPTIAGLSAVVHEDALFMYQDEARPCAESKYLHGDTERAATTMCKIVADMSEDDIVAIAAHYAALSFVPARQKFDAALAEAGAAVHEEHCDRCHSDGGANADDDAGILAGQWIGYMRQSFADYASGAREQPGKMKSKMEKLGDDDVEALLHYYASQQ